MSDRLILLLKMMLVYVVIGFTAGAAAQSDVKETDQAALVPQHLLGIVHAPEVHAELKLEPQQVQKLEQLFLEIDGDWFRARNLPAEKQRATLTRLESQVNQWFKSNATPAQIKRLRQLEYRSLGIRMLLRPELAQSLQLTESQLESLTELARATNQANEDLRMATMRGSATESLKQAAVQAGQAENAALRDVVQQDQLEKLSKILGETFDTTKLKRIYPMAPELESVQHWINSQPLTMKQLRGKVVLLHFYAFQCHNCHANFGHYKKWHERYRDDEVVVLGIQTPETSMEHDPTAVRKAAQERGLGFPILVDLESKNWTAWSNTMWPTVYVIDKQGYIRHWWHGELNWNGATGDATIESLVEELLREEA